jgi:toluene monooxygenase system protein D
MIPASPPGDRVGPILQRGTLTEAIVAAIRGLNRGVEVLDRGSYVRVSVPLRCRLTRAAVEERIGERFLLLTQLESVMPAFKGRLTLTEDEAVWEAAPEGG